MGGANQPLDEAQRAYLGAEPTPAAVLVPVIERGAGSSLQLQTLQSMVVDDTNQRLFVTGQDSGGSHGFVLRVFDFTRAISNA